LCEKLTLSLTLRFERSHYTRALLFGSYDDEFFFRIFRDDDCDDDFFFFPVVKKISEDDDDDEKKTIVIKDDDYHHNASGGGPTGDDQGPTDEPGRDASRSSARLSLSTEKKQTIANGSQSVPRDHFNAG
jgi:hypothetical protein